MEKILSEELMVILFQVQPPKQRIPADYVISRPIAAYCGTNCYSTCQNGCKNSCKGGCKSSCTGHWR